jgi:hypothetical protein
VPQIAGGLLGGLVVDVAQPASQGVFVVKDDANTAPMPSQLNVDMKRVEATRVLAMCVVRVMLVMLVMLVILVTSERPQRASKSSHRARSRTGRIRTKAGGGLRHCRMRRS